MPDTVIILGTYTNPALSYHLEALMRAKLALNLHVFLDSKEPSGSEMAIWEERTEGRLPGLPLNDFPEVQFHFVKNHNSVSSAELMRKLGAVLAVNCGTPRILKTDVLSAPTLGVLNLHPGKLPDYRGCTAVEWAVYNDDPVYLTAHIMREEIDFGPILGQQRVTVSPGDSYADVRVNVFRTAYDMLPTMIGAILRNRSAITSLPMPGAGRYWKVIDDDKMAEVKRKLSEGRYPAMPPADVEMVFPRGAS